MFFYIFHLLSLHAITYPLGLIIANHFKGNYFITRECYFFHCINITDSGQSHFYLSRGGFIYIYAILNITKLYNISYVTHVTNFLFQLWFIVGHESAFGKDLLTFGITLRRLKFRHSVAVHIYNSFKILEL